MRDQRWGFEDGDDWDEVPPAGGQPVGDAAEELIGRDPDGVVSVVVGTDAAVRGVRLDPGWRQHVDPRALHRSVLAAANNATMGALAWQVAAGPPTPATPPAAPADETPLTRTDVRRLLDAVAGEVDLVTSRLAAVSERSAPVASAGRHVSAVSRRGQVVEVCVDANWASSARHTEIESELLDVLTRLRRDGNPGGLAEALHGSAITELNALASDPQLLLRRLGLLPGSEEL